LSFPYMDWIRLTSSVVSCADAEKNRNRQRGVSHFFIIIIFRIYNVKRNVPAK